MLNPYIYRLNMNVDYKLDEIHKVAKKVTQEINSNIQPIGKVVSLFRDI